VRTALAAMVAVAGLALASGSSSEPVATHGIERVQASGNITSTAFPEGGAIPARFTCDGDDVAPPLRWRLAVGGSTHGPPLLMALVVVDVDAPKGPFVHWFVLGLPFSGAFAEGGTPVGATGGTEGRNSFGEVGYSGPCPPPGDGPHRYQFRLYATRVGPEPGATVEDAFGGVPAQRPIAMLTGTYDRS
jgi:Raf kinase inhibitor-like YbhB/YbcL family protein